MKVREIDWVDICIDTEFTLEEKIKLLKYLLTNK